MEFKVFCFDVDGTICSNTDGKHEQAVPYQDRIQKINQLYDQGHRIILLTARGQKTGTDWRDATIQQLEEWGVKYHEISFSKPWADYYIDDRCINLEFFHSPLFENWLDLRWGL